MLNIFFFVDSQRFNVLTLSEIFSTFQINFTLTFRDNVFKMYRRQEYKMLNHNSGHILQYCEKQKQRSIIVFDYNLIYKSSERY